ncbi:protein of unknown function [Candidatus Methylocalor cossyra]|uniref:Uncharacterized protein n=1 Tax=Candidatus Methylocalor cossyra TaxID=3108543 RepID=A0ABM9NEJ7_9GAMM
MIALLKSPAPEQIPARHRRNNQYNRYTLPVNPPHASLQRGAE